MTRTIDTPELLVPSTGDGRAVLAKFFRAVGDPTRLSLLQFVSEVERTGSECVDHAGIAQSRVSSHLACLVTCGLVSLRREGRFAYYSVTDSRVVELVRVGAEVAAENAARVAACARVG